MIFCYTLYGLWGEFVQPITAAVRSRLYLSISRTAVVHAKHRIISYTWAHRIIIELNSIRKRPELELLFRRRYESSRIVPEDTGTFVSYSGQWLDNFHAGRLCGGNTVIAYVIIRAIIIIRVHGRRVTRMVITRINVWKRTTWDSARGATTTHVCVSSKKSIKKCQKTVSLTCVKSSLTACGFSHLR